MLHVGQKDREGDCKVRRVGGGLKLIKNNKIDPELTHDFGSGLREIDRLPNSLTTNIYSMIKI